MSSPIRLAPVEVEMRMYRHPAGVVASNNTAMTSTWDWSCYVSLVLRQPSRDVSFPCRRGIEGGEDVTDTVSGSFVISSAEHVATSLTFAAPHGQQPTGAGVGAVITPAVKVAVLDQFGSLYTASPVTVTLSLATSPGGATLSGTLARATSGGVATFDNLSLNVAATNYSLQATAPGGLTRPHPPLYHHGPARCHRRPRTGWAFLRTLRRYL